MDLEIVSLVLSKLKSVSYFVANTHTHFIRIIHACKELQMWRNEGITLNQICFTNEL